MEEVKCNVNGVNYVVDLGPLSFSCSITNDPEYGWMLVLSWSRPTQYINITWLRMLTIRPRSPWITHLASFITDA